MAEVKTLNDHFGVILDAQHRLPDDRHRLQFLAGLAELEHNANHKSRSFPLTRLHKVVGTKKAIYRADVDKTSGWRFHIQYVNGELHLKDVIPGALHDRVLEVIHSKRHRYS
jgi:hypothetical protein